MSHKTRVTSSLPARTTFLSIFTPIEVWYASEKILSTKRRTRLVLPTENEPSMQIFFCSIRGLVQFTGDAGVNVTLKVTLRFRRRPSSVSVVRKGWVVPTRSEERRVGKECRS